jgi:hypothetical protein
MTKKLSVEAQFVLDAVQRFGPLVTAEMQGAIGSNQWSM